MNPKAKSEFEQERLHYEMHLINSPAKGYFSIFNCKITISLLSIHYETPQID